MSFGLEPTQMDEFRKKHSKRLFVEERLVEIGQLIALSASTTADIFDTIFLSFPSLFNLLRKHRKQVIFGLGAATLIAMMIL